MADVVVSVLLVLGCGIVLLAAVGLNRFEGVFAKMHAATKSATLGLLLVLAAAAARAEPRAVPAIVLVGVLQLLTAPISAHLVGRAAYRTSRWERDRLAVDELAEAEAARPAQDERS